MSQLSPEQLLHLHGYRSTPQRHFILKVLEPEQTHLTIEQILERVHQWCPTMTLSTVYHTLELLLHLEVVRVTYVSGQQPCYERVTDPTHHHLLCRRCHALTHLNTTLLGDLSKRLAEEYHYHHLHLELQVTGYCETCWQAERHSHQEASVSLNPAAQ